MNDFLLLATDHGVVIAQREGDDWREASRSLIDQHVTSLIAREGVILAGTTRGVFRSDDVGQSWREASAGLKYKHVRWLAYHPDISDREFAGTEPAGIYVSHDGAQTCCFLQSRTLTFS
jgi:ligand-binding sensor domain-containing protein